MGAVGCVGSDGGVPLGAGWVLSAAAAAAAAAVAAGGGGGGGGGEIAVVGGGRAATAGKTTRPLHPTLVPNEVLPPSSST